MSQPSATPPSQSLQPSPPPGPGADRPRGPDAGPAQSSRRRRPFPDPQGPGPAGDALGAGGALGGGVSGGDLAAAGGGGGALAAAGARSPAAASGPGPLRRGATLNAGPGATGAPPAAARALTLAEVARRPLEGQGVELLRLGTDGRGHAELHLQVRCGDAVLEARLAEDGAGGVRVALGGTLEGNRLERLAGALEAKGHDAALDPRAGGEADSGSRHRDPPPEGHRHRPPDGAPGARPDRRVARVGPGPGGRAGRPAPPRRPGPGRGYVT